MACETLVFEWNGEDTSQFEGSVAFADGGAAGQLVVTSSAEHGPILRVSGTAGFTGHIAFLATEPISFPDDRRDLKIELDIFDGTYGAGGYGGVVVLADDDTTYHAINHLAAGVAEWGSRVDAGSRSTAGTTGTGVGGNGGFVVFNIRGEKVAGSPPSISSYFENWTASDHGGEPRRTGNQRGSVTAFGGGSALAASWNNLDCDRWGLCLQSSGGNPLANVQMDILSLKVYRVG